MLTCSSILHFNLHINFAFQNCTSILHVKIAFQNAFQNCISNCISNLHVNLYLETAIQHCISMLISYWGRAGIIGSDCTCTAITNKIKNYWKPKKWLTWFVSITFFGVLNVFFGFSGSDLYSHNQ